MNITLINKNNNKQYTVYDITYDKAGYPHFLIYKDGQWLRMSAKHFRPFNNEDFMKVMEDWGKTGSLRLY
jgi:hypothetical protein